MTIHRDLAEGRWRSMTLAEQMGNIGSEVGRAIRAKAAGQSDRLEGGTARALELFDLTLDDDRWAGSKRREIGRAREIVCDFLAGENAHGSTAQSLDAYFMAFAFAARRNR